MKDLFLIMHHPMHEIECFLQDILNCSLFSRSLFPLPLPPFKCLHYYHCLLGGTVGCQRDCIRSCHCCVILQNFKLKQKGMLGHMNDICRDDNYSECFNMQLTSAGSSFLFQSLNKGAPPTPPLPLLFPPKALTASNLN